MSMGGMSCCSIAATCSGRSRRARMPPWTFGWSVFTRASIISGKPVTSQPTVTPGPFRPGGLGDLLLSAVLAGLGGLGHRPGPAGGDDQSLGGGLDFLGRGDNRRRGRAIAGRAGVRHAVATTAADAAGEDALAADRAGGPVGFGTTDRTRCVRRILGEGGLGRDQRKGQGAAREREQFSVEHETTPNRITVGSTLGGPMWRGQGVRLPAAGRGRALEGIKAISCNWRRTWRTALPRWRSIRRRATGAA